MKGLDISVLITIIGALITCIGGTIAYFIKRILDHVSDLKEGFAAMKVEVHHLHSDVGNISREFKDETKNLDSRLRALEQKFMSRNSLFQSSES